MTCLARRGEPGRCVIRIRRCIIVGCMAHVTTRIGELIVPVCMARLALNRRMGARQREFRGRMIECCRRPGCRRMTCCAGMAEVARHVVRIGRSGEIR